VRNPQGRFVKLTHDDFLARLDRSGECWIYTGPHDRDGYGKFGRNRHAHVYAYQHWVGSVPEGCEIDHKCRVRDCCNPDHLQAVSHRVNVLLGESPSAVHAQKTHCLRGHELPRTRDKRGERVCQQCNTEAVRRYRAGKT